MQYKYENILKMLVMPALALETIHETVTENLAEMGDKGRFAAFLQAAAAIQRAWPELIAGMDLPADEARFVWEGVSLDERDPRRERLTEWLESDDHPVRQALGLFVFQMERVMLSEQEARQSFSTTLCYIQEDVYRSFVEAFLVDNWDALGRVSHA